MSQSQEESVNLSWDSAKLSWDSAVEAKDPSAVYEIPYHMIMAAPGHMIMAAPGNPARKIETACPNLTKHVLPPDQCDCYRQQYGLECTARITDIVMHMNDKHQWSRESIADWLDSLEIDLTIDMNATSHPGAPITITAGALKFKEAVSEKEPGPIVQVMDNPLGLYVSLHTSELNPILKGNTA